MKNLKTFLITILLMSILITSLFLCSCHDDDEPNNQDWIKIHNYYIFSLKCSNYSTKINSVEDITTLCDEDSSPIFNKDGYDQNKQIIDTLKDYDEEFFINKSLIVLFRHKGSAGYSYYVKDFEINEESLNITLARDLPKEPVGYPLLVVTSVYLLEFPKEQVKDVTQINVQEILIKK